MAARHSLTTGVTKTAGEVFSQAVGMKISFDFNRFLFLYNTLISAADWGGGNEKL